METKELQFKTIQIIYGAFIMGVVAFSFYTLNDISNINILIDTNDVFMLIIPTLSAFSLVLNTFLFKNSLKAINQEDSLQTKMTKYQSAIIIRGAVLEAPALLGVIATSKSGNYFFMLFSMRLMKNSSCSSVKSKN